MKVKEALMTKNKSVSDIGQALGLLKSIVWNIQTLRRKGTQVGSLITKGLAGQGRPLQMMTEELSL